MAGRLDYLLSLLGPVNLAIPIFVIRNPQSIVYIAAVMVASIALIGFRRFRIQYCADSLPIHQFNE